MFQLLSIIQLVLAILLVILVLIQRANTDASGAFGSDGGNGAILEKRGAEKVIYRMTIIVVFLFVTSVLYPVLIG